MQNIDQTPPLVAPLTPITSISETSDSVARRSRVPGAYACRSGPRSSRYAAVRESCASFRLACSLRRGIADAR